MISVENELRVYSILGIKIMQALDQYHTKIEEDRQILSQTVDYQEKHLRRLLISEKEILQNAVDFCKNQKEILKQNQNKS